MTTFPFNPAEPAANTPPSISRVTMQLNNNSIFNIFPVDHVGFGNLSGGQHLQITFNSNNVPGFTPTNPMSILYTNNNASGNPQLLWKNSQDTFQINAVKCWGVITGSGTSTTYGCTYTYNSTGIYTITFSKALPNNNYAVIATGSASGAIANNQSLVTSYNQLTGSFQLIQGSRTTAGGNFFLLDQFPIGFVVLSTGG